jgi:hypothetical protein
MATAAPSYLELSKTYQDQVLSLMEQSQKLAVESVSAWTKAVQPLAKNAPAAPVAGLPTPKEIVDNQYAFAAKLLEAQHEYLSAVLTAAAPVLPKAAPVAK